MFQRKKTNICYRKYESKVLFWFFYSKKIEFSTLNLNKKFDFS